MKNLRELYLAELRVTYGTLRTLMPALTELAREGRDPRLSAALIELNRAVARSIDGLGDLFRRHETDPTAARSKLAETMLDETRRRVIEAEFADEGTRDMAIVAQARRLTALAVSGLGTLADLAPRLDEGADGETLAGGLAALTDHAARIDALARGPILTAAVTGD